MWLDRKQYAATIKLSGNYLLSNKCALMFLFVFRHERALCLREEQMIDNETSQFDRNTSVSCEVNQHNCEYIAGCN